MPQPIDFQSELGRVTAAERVQQINDRLSLAAQHKAAEEIQQERLATETQVQQPHAQSEEIEQDTRRRNPFVGRRRRRQPEPTPPAGADEVEFLPNPKEPHHLDVSI